MKKLILFLLLFAFQIQSQTLNYLIVAKGGDSYNAQGGGTGGGAGGGLSQGTITATTGTFAVVVGTLSGSGNSSAVGFTATEGGYGGYYDSALEDITPPTSGGQGSGGAGGFVGVDGSAGAGVGVVATIDGLTYAVGGTGGSGSTNGSNGTANRGNGANGCGPFGAGGGTGGTGIVKLRYTTGQITATGGSITTGGGFTIHEFTANGNFIVTAVSGGSPNNSGIRIFFQQ